MHVVERETFFLVQLCYSKSSQSIVKVMLQRVQIGHLRNGRHSTRYVTILDIPNPALNLNQFSNYMKVSHWAWLNKVMQSFSSSLKSKNRKMIRALETELILFAFDIIVNNHARGVLFLLFLVRFVRFLYVVCSCFVRVLYMFLRVMNFCFYIFCMYLLIKKCLKLSLS